MLYIDKTILDTGTVDLDITNQASIDSLVGTFRLIGTVTLTGNSNVDVSSVNVVTGSTLYFIYVATVTLATNHIYILGTQVPDELATKKFSAEGTYNGTTWDVVITPSFSETEIVDTDRIKALAITNAKVNDVDGSKIAAASIPASKMVAHTLTANEIAASTITATEIANTTITGSKLAAATIPLTKLATQADSTVLGNNSGGTAVPTALSKTDLRSIISYVAPQTVLTVPVSFETGEQADNTITIPFACTLVSTYISAYATHAIAVTNNATITLEKNGVAITGGVITFTASAAINTAGTVTAFSVVTFAAGDTLNLISAKVTAGGKAIVSIPLVLI